jgi:ABC-2 type transport system ATP-binding protein
MIDVKNLVKWYGPTLAVDNLNFHIPQGAIVGFLGPNGAGKTTTLRMLTGYLPPTSGSATIAGIDVADNSAQARAKIGYLPESTPLYLEMRVEEYLHFRGKLFHMSREQRNKRIAFVCDSCGLTANRRRLIGQLSKGNRQRVGIAQALLHDPPVLILDEPTAGLDPNQISHVRSLISTLKGMHTILLSTHILPEIEKTADSIIIIASGKIVAEGTPDQLRKKVSHGAKILVETSAPYAPLRDTLARLDKIASVEVTALEAGWSRAVITPKSNADARADIGAALLAAGWAVREMRFETASLEQFFVQITAQQSQATSGAA